MKHGTREQYFHNRKALRDLTNKDIADAMTQLNGERVSEASVQSYFAGDAGIPISKIVNFLTALGLKVVDEKDVMMEPEQRRSMLMLAKAEIERQIKES